MKRRFFSRMPNGADFVTLALSAALVTASCSNSGAAGETDTTTFSPSPVLASVSDIIALAPYAYTGKCTVTVLAPDRWEQPELNLGGSLEFPPQPCANMHVTVTQDGVQASAGLSAEVSPGGSAFTWQPPLGVQTEWLLGFTSGGTFPAHTGSYQWGNSDPAEVSVYANDVNAPPGEPVPITVALLPNP